MAQISRQLGTECNWGQKSGLLISIFITMVHSGYGHVKSIKHWHGGQIQLNIGAVRPRSDVRAMFFRPFHSNQSRSTVGFPLVLRKCVIGKIAQFSPENVNTFTKANKHSFLSLICHAEFTAQCTLTDISWKDNAIGVSYYNSICIYADRRDLEDIAYMYVQYPATSL